MLPELYLFEAAVHYDFWSCNEEYWFEKLAFTSRIVVKRARGR